MKIIEYAVWSNRWADGLTVDVCTSLKAGWQPHGAPFSHDGYIYQAMVRYEQ